MRIQICGEKSSKKLLKQFFSTVRDHEPFYGPIHDLLLLICKLQIVTDSGSRAKSVRNRPVFIFLPRDVSHAFPGSFCEEKLRPAIIWNTPSRNCVHRHMPEGLTLDDLKIFANKASLFNHLPDQKSFLSVATGKYSSSC